MGDSEKVWPVTQSKFSASMAVKAVRVWVDDARCQHGPIKLGDAADNVKITGDTLLEQNEFFDMISRAAENRDFVKSSVQSGKLVGSTEMLILTDETGKIVTMNHYFPQTPPNSF